ncbi:indolepyruvate ferredoxin oxidoreductase subunit alpha [Candidatus Formimonas warabiya]|uniref:Indolepyruvate oxidoreductase subunit IorA n=1 Tax=Formimonas warabiya TaxID=1761012 RepID=A0A3G1L013_FORW1|nr:indolepyruvate ferredoxin oxidoreductase subunit alpha [Candidatus Formimonas warabiya]ATW27997.1 indolepyruvate ferredoxin oxidoreductase subunit alpha [Candidatus Formimonas warabiya]
MKKLMSGNEAIARGAFEAGCSVAAAYPGTPSTEILENLSLYKEIYAEWSPNEKVALEVACGASISGARSLAAMKHVGLNVAADPFFTMAYEGVNGGLVIVSADDPGMHSSQNEQDNRLYAPFAKVAMMEPADSQECKGFIKEAFEVSEKYDIPVLFRVTTRICHSKGLVETGDPVERVVKDYKKDVKKYVMTPAHARIIHYEVEKRLARLKNYANHCPLNKIEWGSKEIGIVTSGISYQHAREVFGNNASYLKIGFSHPLPDEMIRKFAQVVGKLYVIEENEPYLEHHIKSLGFACVGKEYLPICEELNPDIIRKAFLPKEDKKLHQVDIQAPHRPPVLCPGCPHRGVYYALSKYKDVVVTGDIGCYTLGMMPPLNVTDVVICMGASVSAGIGFKRGSMQGNRNEKVFGSMGDSTFFHSGITGLIDVVYNKTPMVLVILDNSITAMTGHQENPGTGKTIKGEITTKVDIAQIVRAVGIKGENIRIIDPYDLTATNNAVKDAYHSEEPFVIITKQPCALIKEVQKKRAGLHCVVDQEKCTKCKACIRTGCPAIALKHDRVEIDSSMCNGCTLCVQVCKFDSITKAGE